MCIPRTCRVLLAILLSLMACVSSAIMAGAEPDSPTARVDPNTTDSPWAGVVEIRLGERVYTGVVISPRHVLTAAHVAGAAESAPHSVQVVLNFGRDASHVLAVDQVRPYPGNSFPYDDLVLLRLAEPVPDGVPVYPVNDLPVARGVEMTLVGYGASGHGDVGPVPGNGSSMKRVGWNALDAMTNRVDNSGRTSYFYLYDFDGPEGNGEMGAGTLGNARETVVGSGDSGSPAFIISAYGYRAVLGINTFATPLNSGKPLNHSFGQGGGGIFLAPRFLDWLDEASGGMVRRLSSLPPPTSRLPMWIGGGVVVSALAGYAGWRWLRSEAPKT